MQTSKNWLILNCTWMLYPYSRLIQRFTLLVVLLLLWNNAVAQTSGNRYEISIDPSLRNIQVSATLERNGDYLTMDWEAAEFLPDGWSTYVSDLVAISEKGNRMPLKYERPGKWLIEGESKAKMVKFDYKVTIGHDSITWEEGGHDESAYVLKDMLFFIGRVMFITAGQRPELPDKNQYIISFKNLPSNYTVTSIWSSVNNSKTDWLAKGTHELIGSLVLVGDQLTQQIQKGGADVLLSSSPDYKTGLETFANVFHPLLESAQKVFGNLDESTFVLAANVAPAIQEPYFSGGVLHRSISIISPFVPDESVLPMIQHILYHEYMHLYGLAMNLESKEMYSNYWFSEGVHDYMSTLLLVGSGRITNEELLPAFNGLTGNWNNYLPVAGQVNIRQAGTKKFDNYDLIYSGGHIIGALMDIAFIQHSEGKYDLLTYMKEVLDMGVERGKNEKTVSFNDLYQLAVRRGGSSLKDILDQYVKGTEIIPFEKHLAIVGLKLTKDEEGNPLVAIDENASADARRLREMYFNREVFKS